MRRAVIIDFMCVSRYGHNANSLIHFHRSLAERFDDIRLFVSRLLSDNVGFPAGTHPIINFPYYDIRRMFERDHPRNWRNHCLNRFCLVQVFCYSVLYRLTGWDGFLTDSIRQLARGLRLVDVKAGDLIFLPSTDYYGAVALLTLLARRTINAWPHVHLRFLNVLEHKSSTSRHPRADITRLVRRLVLEGAPISISAETEALAELLRRILAFDVAVLPYPAMRFPGGATDASRASPRYGKYVCLSPGQGRSDKGFFRLLNIARLVQEKSYGEVEFRIQNLHEKEPYYRTEYTQELRRHPNVTVLPSTLTNEELDIEYRAASVVIMPYDKDAYALRGSAVLAEAIAYNVPVVATNGCGFGATILKYEAGRLATSDEDFAEAIISLIRQGSCSDRMCRAYRLYVHAYTQAIDHLGRAENE